MIRSIWKRVFSRFYGMQSRSFYRKSLLLVLTITSVPTALIGITMNVFGTRSIIKETNQSHQLLLEKSAQRIDKSFSDLEMALPPWLLNPTFENGLRTREFYGSYRSYSDLNRTLVVIQSSNALIDRIYIYLNDPPVIVSNEEGFVKLTDDQEINQTFRQLLEGESMIWKEEMPLLGKGKPPTLALVNTLPFHGSGRYGAIIAYINKKELVKSLNDTAQSGSAFLMDSDGKLLAFEEEGEEADALRNELKARILEKKAAEGSFIFTWRHEEYSVGFKNLSRLGNTWILATAVPLSKLTAPVKWLSSMNLMISGVGILTAIILSWFASNRLYRPIRKLTAALHNKRGDAYHDEFAFIEQEWKQLLEESSMLHDKLDQSLSSMRNGFLMQLLQGYYGALNEQELRDRMRNLGWKLEQCQYLILFVQLHGFSRLEGRFKKGDEQLVTFAAGNIIKEVLMRQWPDSEVVDFQDMTLFSWIVFPQDTDEQKLKDQLFEACKEAVTNIQTIFNLYVTIVMGRRISELTRLAPTAGETRQAARYREFEEANQILDLDMLIADKTAYTYYPGWLENEIVRAIRIGDEGQAKSLLGQLLRELQENTGKEIHVKQGLLKLLGSLHQAIVQSGVPLDSFADFTWLYNELLRLSEPNEILEWFHSKIILPFMEGYNHVHDVRMREAVEQLVQLVRSRFMEDISLDSYADSQRVFASSLSLAFRKVMGVNFIDYLTQFRMDQAKELLTSTDLKISDIAEKVGYQPSYFNRIFKKSTGVTPGQYREQAIETKP